MIGTLDLLADFPADLIAVHAGKHQVQKDQVRAERNRNALQSFFPVVDNLYVSKHSLVR